MAVALVAIVGFGAAAYALAPWNGASPSHVGRARGSRPARARDLPFRFHATPGPGATGVPLDAQIEADARGGRIQAITVIAPGGGAVPGYLGRDGSWFLARPGLAPGSTYQVAAVLRPASGGPVRARRWSFTTLTPTTRLSARLNPGDGDVVGVGMPISIQLSAPVANKAAVEARLQVRTSVPVVGSWRWMSDREVHWRPQGYWPAHAEVWVDADLQGVDAGNGVWGDVHRTTHFTIGDGHVSIADATAHTLTVTQNGQVVKVFPMSAGRDKYPTLSGRHIVLGKQQDVLMDSRTNGIPLDSPDGYYEHVFWDVQISTGGEYVHAAPWSVDAQGHDNVSHGCINIAPDNAIWFYGFSQRGDVVEVTGTSRPADNDIAMIDWKLPFDQWIMGSALASSGPAPRVRMI